MLSDVDLAGIRPTETPGPIRSWASVSIERQHIVNGQPRPFGVTPDT
jgi:hypothetical protein